MCNLLYSLIVITDETEFEALVRQAFEEIPARFKDEMENLSIVIEASPNAVQLKYLKKRGFLLGLFEGVPKTAWGQATMGIQPGKITIFRDTITAGCRTPAELKKKIKEVLMHEMAHYFGYNEEQVFVLDRKLRNKS